MSLEPNSIRLEDYRRPGAIVSDQKGRMAVCVPLPRELKPCKDTIYVRLEGGSEDDPVFELWKDDGKGLFMPEAFLPVRTELPKSPAKKETKRHNDQMLKAARRRKARQDRQLEKRRRLMRALDLDEKALKYWVNRAMELKEKEEAPIDLEDPRNSYLVDERKIAADDCKKLPAGLKDWTRDHMKKWLKAMDIPAPTIKLLFEHGLNGLVYLRTNKAALMTAGLSDPQADQVILVRNKLPKLPLDDSDSCRICRTWKAVAHSTAENCSIEGKLHVALCRLCAMQGRVDKCMQCNQLASEYEFLD